MAGVWPLMSTRFNRGVASVTLVPPSAGLQHHMEVVVHMRSSVKLRVVVGGGAGLDLCPPPSLGIPT